MAFKGKKAAGKSRPMPVDLEDLGLEPATKFKARPRLLVAAWGPQKSGRTNLGLSLPAPMVVLTSDPQGLEGVIDKLPAEKVDQIQVFDFRLDTAIVSAGERQRAAQEILDKALRVFISAIAAKVRSIVFDNWSDFYNLRKNAEFGEINPKLTKGERMNKFGDLYVDMKNIINMSVDGDSNLMLIERVKKEYDENDKATGALERVGFRDTAFEVHANLRTDRIGSDFKVTIEDCRHSPEANGMELSGDACTFQQVAGLVMPDVDEEEWN